MQIFSLTKRYRGFTSCSPWAMHYLLGIVLLLSACSSLPQAPSGPALWRVQTRHGTSQETLWLFGTIHRLPGRKLSAKSSQNLTRTRIKRLPTLAWLSAPIRQALKAADALYVEIVPLSKTNLLETLTDGRSVADSNTLPLRTFLNPEQYQQILNAAQQRGIQQEVIDHADPLLAFSLFANMQPQKSRPSEVGADTWLIAHANGLNIPVHGLEVLQDRLLAIKLAISRLHGADQAQILLQYLETEASEVDTKDSSYQAIYRLWLNGDTDIIAESLYRHAAELPEIHEAFTASRNQHWIKTINRLLANGEDEFIAVGMAHVVGPDNLIDLLHERGYVVERVQ